VGRFAAAAFAQSATIRHERVPGKTVFGLYPCISRCTPAVYLQPAVEGNVLIEQAMLEALLSCEGEFATIPIRSEARPMVKHRVALELSA
jgi:hypothetical protein